jgi:hypothetical protein
MNASEHKIDSVRSLENFERGIREYCKNEEIHVDCDCLRRMHSYLSRPCFDPRCRGAYLDLFLQDIILQRDMKIISEITSKEGLLPLPNGFTADRMERYAASSNAAHRIRAMWDKIMGFQILAEEPAKYQAFTNAKSRINAFQRIAKEWIEAPTNVPRNSINADIDLVEKGDVDADEALARNYTLCMKNSLDQLAENVRLVGENYRTSEAHLVGRLSKWAFAYQADEDDPFKLMIQDYNLIREYMSYLVSQVYLKAAYPDAPKSSSH